MNTLWGKTVTNQPTPGPERPLRCLDNITNYSRNSEISSFKRVARTQDLPSLWIQCLLRIPIHEKVFELSKYVPILSSTEKTISFFPEDSLLSVILVIAVEQFVIDPMKHKSDCHWASLRLWQQLVLLLIQKSINLYCNWSSSNMTNLKGHSGPMCYCRGIVLQAMSGTNCTKKWPTVRQPLFGHHDPI